MATPDDNTLAAPNGGSRPVPDPTELTDRAIAKSLAAVTQYIDGQVSVLSTRMDGDDRATKLRLARIDSIPEEIREQVSHLELLLDEKFNSVAKQFTERDIRAEREARDNKVAVDAAFAAQKEAAAKQDEGNQKAIDKSEAATAEKITKLEQLFTASNQGLADKIDDVKERVARIESVATGTIAQRAEGRNGNAAIYGLVGVIISVVLAGLAIIGFIISRAP